MNRRLLLVGAGHAHLEVVRRLGQNREISSTLVTPEIHAAYSGMLSGVVAGSYRWEETRVDMRSLCERSGVDFVIGRATGVFPRQGELRLEDNRRLSYDVISLATGSTPCTKSIAGAAEHGTPAKPLGCFFARWQKLVASFEAGASDVPLEVLEVVVVGGGSAGVELALTMHHRLAAVSQTHAARARVTLVAERVLEDQSARMQRLATSALLARGIALVRERVLQVTDEHVQTASGRRLDADLVVLTTNACAPEWLRESGLALDARGFLTVDRHLRSISHDNVYAAGDIASMREQQVPKSGVYAVREGPVLYQNLCDAMARRTPSAVFRPQKRALAILACGDESAMLSYGAVALSGRWAWRLKEHIDRRFVRKYSAPQHA